MWSWLTSLRSFVRKDWHAEKAKALRCLGASNSAGESGVTNALRREHISAGMCIFLTSRKSNQKKVGINISASQAASGFSCVLQNYPGCMALFWHLPWCKGKGHPCSLWPELGSSHCGEILITPHSLCTKPALAPTAISWKGEKSSNAMQWEVFLD